MLNGIFLMTIAVGMMSVSLLAGAVGSCPPKRIGPAPSWSGGCIAAAAPAGMLRSAPNDIAGVAMLAGAPGAPQVLE